LTDFGRKKQVFLFDSKFVHDDFEALAEIEKRYQSKFCAGPTDAFDPVKAITNVIRWLKKDTVADESYKSIVRSVSKRLDRAKQDIAILCDRKK